MATTPVAPKERKILISWEDVVFKKKLWVVNSCSYLYS